ncbi:MAG: tetratricopeptide repeat protein [Bacteroidota bacterium]
MKSRLFFPLFILLLFIALIVAITIIRTKRSDALNTGIAKYSGSESCRPCHEKFYQLWHDSYHGLAMQPVTGRFIGENIKSFKGEIRVGEDLFSVSSRGDSLIFTETRRSGNSYEYPAIHAMGGKYIYYFLTPLDRGRLQVLPLAYDCNNDSWYNNPESGVRHFETIDDAPLDWMSHLYTFNTTCYSCHVSQLETNYNLSDNTYNTTWREAGINCETCHGPSHDHIVACVEAGEGNIPDDLKIVVTGEFTPEQHNASCASCHAKAVVLAQDFIPGSEFYDYFDLITLENPDFYADGRDLGENYTMTTWEMNKCAGNSDLHCVTCHTSSGRYRFSGADANNACMPCHEDKVNSPAIHTSFMPDNTVSECILCHMPKTSFAMMDRSDHSFRPPMPGASVVFGSPNACNLCHEDQTAGWADSVLTGAGMNNYKDEAIRNGLLIRKAREGDWTDLDKILNGLQKESFDKVYATSFIRLLEDCDDPAKWPHMLKLTYHDSPLVRGAAAHSLYGNGSVNALERLAELTADRYRVVRLNAAYALSPFSGEIASLPDEDRISEVMDEYESSLVVRSDDWSAHYNLGNYYSSLDDYDRALDAYRTSIKLFPGAIMPMVNAGFIYSLSGDYSSAEEMFTRALSYAPDHEAALLNLALLYGETGNNEMARHYFKRLLDVSEKNSVAAYNLAVLESENDLEKALDLSKKAMEWEPDEPKYGYTHAYYLLQSDRTEAAKNILHELIEADSTFFDSYMLLTDIYLGLGDSAKAITILNKAMDNVNLSPNERQSIQNSLDQLIKNEN